MTADKIRAVVFDIGGTLMEYKNMPYVWTDFYPAAFEGVRKRLGLAISDADIKKSAEILKSFNPRINYREEEITPEKIFAEAVRDWGSGFSLSEVITEFFAEFKLVPYIYPETVPTLQRLKTNGYIIAVLTDVAAAMPDEMHKNCFKELLPYFDMYVSSLSCGYRKPNPKGLCDIQNRFGISKEEMIIVGDEKKDIDTAKRFGCAGVLISKNKKPENFGEDFCIGNLNELFELVL